MVNPYFIRRGEIVGYGSGSPFLVVAKVLQERPEHLVDTTLASMYRELDRFVAWRSGDFSLTSTVGDFFGEAMTVEEARVVLFHWFMQSLKPYLPTLQDQVKYVYGETARRFHYTPPEETAPDTSFSLEI